MLIHCHSLPVNVTNSDHDDDGATKGVTILLL